MILLEATLSPELSVKYRMEIDAHNSITEYSIYCSSHDSHGNLIDAECVKHISPCYRRATEIFNKLVENQVTPCTLKDVITDLLSQ